MPTRKKKGVCKKRKKKKNLKTSWYDSNLPCLTFSRHGAQAALQMLIKTCALPSGCTEVLQILVLPGASVETN